VTAVATATPRMSAADVRAALRYRWPADRALMIEEAPQDAMRQGRKLDVLAISLWQSRGYDLDGVEIKVSYADWQRERDNPAKADWWWEHTHRFWVACPIALATRIRDELPPGWGLLACTESSTAALVKPERRDAKPVPWPSIVGLLRASSGAGVNALRRERDAGFAEGEQVGRRRAERDSGDQAVREALDRLRDRVAAFEAAAGVRIADNYSASGAAAEGRLFAAVRGWAENPRWVVQQMARLAASTDTQAAQMRELAKHLSEVLGIAAGDEHV
jgi:hypothetical protein